MGSRVHEPVSDRHVGQRHLERLVMLSDGVFAIAITLSAIEIKPVAQPGQTLWQVWSTPLLIYFLSFLLIGSIWASHRRMVAHLRDIDAVGTAINLLLLSLVALIPVVVRFVFEGFKQGARACRSTRWRWPSPTAAWGCSGPMSPSSRGSRRICRRRRRVRGCWR